jgi:hypothetical protein
MSQYSVMIDDNFHYMKEEDRLQFGTFSTAEEAVAACPRLESHNKPGMTAKDLYDLYVMFGEDPFVLPTDRATAVDQANWDFGAWDYESSGRSCCAPVRTNARGGLIAGRTLDRCERQFQSGVAASATDLGSF